MKKKKKKQKSQNENYPIYGYEVDIFWSPEDKAFIANVPELSGCKTHGETRVHAAEMAEEAIHGYVESLKSRGIEPPIPLSQCDYSGEFLVRAGPDLHRDLMTKAMMEKTSLNKLVVKRLRESL